MMQDQTQTQNQTQNLKDNIQGQITMEQELLDQFTALWQKADSRYDGLEKMVLELKTAQNRPLTTPNALPAESQMELPIPAGETPEIKMYQNTMVNSPDVFSELNYQDFLGKLHSTAPETKSLNTKVWEYWLKTNTKLPQLDGMKANISDEKVQEMQALLPAEYKAMAVSQDIYGGYWVPPQLSDRLILYMYRFNPFRQIANVVTLPNSDVYEMVRETNAPEVEWIAERGTRAETGTTVLAKERIVTHSMYCYPKNTTKILRLASFNVEQWLMESVSRRMAWYEGVSFISGTGAGQPQGINNSIALPQYVTSGSATTIPDLDPLICMQDTLLEQYQPEACWIMNRGTKSLLRQMKDALGRYILEPAVIAGQPDSLFGKPIYYMAAMPAVTTGSAPIIYGNFKEAYTIVDNPAIQTIQDPFTAPGFVKYLFQKDVGGSAVNPQAAIRLVISA
jgi:HK97 family phage major capsid protein